MAGDVEVDDAAAAADGKIGGRGCRANAGKRSGAIDQAIVKAVALFRPSVGRVRKRKIGDKEMIGLETDRECPACVRNCEEQA